MCRRDHAFWRGEKLRRSFGKSGCPKRTLKSKSFQPWNQQIRSPIWNALFFLMIDEGRHEVALKLKIGYPQRKLVFQPSNSRCYSMLVSGSVFVFCNATDLRGTNYLLVQKLSITCGLALPQTLLDSRSNRSNTTSQSLDLSFLHTPGQIPKKTCSLSPVFRSSREKFLVLPFWGLRSAEVLTRDPLLSM